MLGVVMLSAVMLNVVAPINNLFDGLMVDGSVVVSHHSLDFFINFRLKKVKDIIFFEFKIQDPGSRIQGPGSTI